MDSSTRSTTLSATVCRFDNLLLGDMEIFRTHFQNHSWRYTVAQELIELGTHFHHSCRCLFLYDQICNFMTVQLPIRFSYRKRTRKIGPVQEKGLRVTKGEIRGRMTTYDCILRASRTSNAFRRFPLASLAMSFAASGGRSNFSFFATCCKHNCIYKGRFTLNQND